MKTRTKKWSPARIAELIEYFNRNVYDFIGMRLPAAMRPRMEHIDRSVQVKNARAVNSEIYSLGGKESIEEYNRENCRIHTGMEPHELKEFGALLGLKTRERATGREAARNIMPAAACAMSLADHIVRKGYRLEKAALISKRSIALFDALLRLGLAPRQSRG